MLLFYTICFPSEKLSISIHFKHVYLYFMQHSSNNCLNVFTWSFQNLTHRGVGILLIVFSLTIDHISLGFVCWAVLDCILNILNSMLWLLLHPLGKVFCGLCYFARQSTHLCSDQITVICTFSRALNLSRGRVAVVRVYSVKLFPS